MSATEIINSLTNLVNKHGDLDVYINDELGYGGESESSGIRFAEEIDDQMIDEENYLPKRFYIKT